MGRKASAPPQGAQAVGDGLANNRSYHARWPYSGRNTVVAVSAMGLLAIAAVGVIREATRVDRAPSPALSRPDVTQPRAAFTHAEEAYVQALWPIHGEVERTSARVSLGNIFYKMNDLGRADLEPRIDAALATYRQAETRAGALQPPPSLAKAHAEYLAAIQLFEQSAVEELKMFNDRNDEHLLAAHSLSQEGTNKIREVGIQFWRDEYPPN